MYFGVLTDHASRWLKRGKGVITDHAQEYLDEMDDQNGFKGACLK